MDSKEKFTHLGQLAASRPSNKARVIRLLWPEIEAALASGHTLKDITEHLAKDGLIIPYSRLREYVARLRKELPAAQARNQRSLDSTSISVRTMEKSTTSTVAAIQEQRIRKEQREFRHNPSPSEEDLI